MVLQHNRRSPSLSPPLFSAPGPDYQSILAIYNWYKGYTLDKTKLGTKTLLLGNHLTNQKRGKRGVMQQLLGREVTNGAFPWLQTILKQLEEWQVIVSRDQLGETFEQLQHYSKRDPGIKSSVCCTLRFGLGLVFSWHGILSVILPLLAAQFATLQTRGKLGPVNSRKDVWECYKGRETIDLASLVTIPETTAGHVSAPVPFSFLNANVAFFFTALCLPCFLRIFSRHATGFLRTTRQTNPYRTGSDQPCNSLNGWG